MVTQDTVRRQTIHRHREHWSHKTQYEDKQFRDTGNIGQKRHSTMKNHPETQRTLVTQDTVRRQTIQRHGNHWQHKTQYEDKQSRDTGNIGHKRHRTKKNNSETRGTLITKVKVPRQAIQRHREHWSHKTQHENKQSRDTGNIGHTRHNTKANNPETRGTLATQDTVRRHTILIHGEHWHHKTQYEDNKFRDTGNMGHTRYSTMKNQPKDRGNKGHTRHSTKTNNS